jgi:hypothetical protein
LRLGHLNEESRASLKVWADSLASSSKTESFVRLGFGLSLFAAWDKVTDALIDEGRGAEFDLLRGPADGIDDEATTSIE